MTATTHPSPNRSTATALVAGGLLWAAAAAIPGGGEEGTTRFYLAESAWTVAMLLLLLGTVLLWRLGPHGRRRTGTVGFAVATVGRTAFLVAEVFALATGELQEVLLPISALLTALGMLTAGIAVMRERAWPMPWRALPLAVGIYPFVAMFPLAASNPDGPPAAAVLGWGLVAAGLGFAVVKASERDHGQSRRRALVAADDLRG